MEYKDDDREVVPSDDFEIYLPSTDRFARLITGDELSDAELSANFPPIEGSPMILVLQPDSNDQSSAIAKFNSYRHAAVALKRDPRIIEKQVGKGSLKVWPARLVTDHIEFDAVETTNQHGFPEMYRQQTQVHRGPKKVSIITNGDNTMLCFEEIEVRNHQTLPAATRPLMNCKTFATALIVNSGELRTPTNPGGHSINSTGVLSSLLRVCCIGPFFDNL
ncbi:hypothetical protein DFS34DRAFT_654165 [Phlyctochytrium arcticum]|nr:hypothetical protein DFS34DRAFT_654165 [Phlyctochytrium arcticum]